MFENCESAAFIVEKTALWVQKTHFPDYILCNFQGVLL